MCHQYVNITTKSTTSTQISASLQCSRIVLFKDFVFSFINKGSNQCVAIDSFEFFNVPMHEGQLNAPFLSD